MRASVSLVTVIGALLFAKGALGAPDVQYETYMVHIGHGETLKQAINRASPIVEAGEHFHAYTSSTLQWNFQMTEEEGVCQVTKVVPNFKVRIIVPQLHLGPRVSYADKEEFGRYHHALVDHEKGHANYTRLAARDIGRLNGMMANTCQQLGELFNLKAKAIVEKYKQESHRYDVVTDHGKRTGAWLE